MQTLGLRISLASCLVLGLAATCRADDGVAAQIEALYRAQRRAEARVLLAKTRGAGAWDAHPGVEVRAVFRSRAEGLTVEATRKAGARGELLVAVEPGTWAAPSDDPRDCPQDLLLLSGRVLRLKPGEARASATLPVACAAFRRQGPQPGRRYLLRKARPGSNLDRLAQVLCAKALPHERDPELALAIWIAHEALGFERLRQSAGFHTFRTPRKLVTVEHGAAAADLLREAGLEPARFEFFRAQGWTPAPDEEPRADEPQPEPQPQPEPPTPDLS